MNSQQTVSIQTKTDVVSVEYDKIQIEFSQYNLKTSAKFIVKKLLSGAGMGGTDRFVGNLLLSMEGDDFLNWGTDDSYVVNWVLTQLNAVEEV